MIYHKNNNPEELQTTYNNYKNKVKQKNNLFNMSNKQQVVVLEAEEKIKNLNPEFLEIHKKNLSPEYINSNIESLIEKLNVTRQDYQTTSDTFSNIDKALDLKTFNNLPGVKMFLKEHNNIQRNPIKRFFNIQKNPLKISNKDKRYLKQVFNTKYKPILKEKNHTINLITEEKKTWEAVDDYFYKKQNLTHINNQFQKISSDLKTQEKPILKVIDNLLDLNFNELKKTIEKHNISVKYILLFLMEFIDRKLVAPNNNIIVLKEKLESSSLKQSPKELPAKKTNKSVKL